MKSGQGEPAVEAVVEGYDSLVNDRMLRMSAAGHHGVETAVPVIVVLDLAHSAIWLHERVRTFHHVTVSFFLLLLDVARVTIFYTVVEVVFRVSL